MKILELKEVSKSFGGLMAVDRVDLAVQKGEMVGLIGPNGAGKTTLFSLISCFLKVSRGEICFDGKRIDHMKCHQLCHLGVGRTFQIVQPFPEFTTLENVMVGSFNETRDVQEAMGKAAEVCDFLGIGHLKGIKAKNLNLADRKRLEIARAMATRPKMLLLDEVMAGLNPTESGMIIELVKQIHHQGVTILIIEHVMKVIMALSQRIVVLNYGRKIADGSPEAISRNPKVIKAYLGENAFIKS